LSSSIKDRLYFTLLQGPRYGWHCTPSFTAGYGLPLEDFLFESVDGRRYINLTFGIPQLDTVVDDFATTIILPEGSKNPQAIVHFPTKTSYSYHDAGRAKVVIKKKNVVGEHNVPFQVYYESNPIFMLADPSTLWAVIIGFVVVCVAYFYFA